MIIWTVTITFGLLLFDLKDNTATKTVLENGDGATCKQTKMVVDIRVHLYFNVEPIQETFFL